MFICRGEFETMNVKVSRISVATFGFVWIWMMQIVNQVSSFVKYLVRGRPSGRKKYLFGCISNFLDIARYRFCGVFWILGVWTSLSGTSLPLSCGSLDEMYRGKIRVILPHPFLGLYHPQFHAWIRRIGLGCLC